MMAARAACVTAVALAVLMASHVAAQDVGVQNVEFASSLARGGGKNWAAVIADCHAAGRDEKRIYSFYTRAAFHDALSVNVTKTPIPCTNCGGTDGSLFLASDEITRIENSLVDNWGAVTSSIVLGIANKHGVSVADTIALCGFVAPNGLNPRVDLFKFQKFPVGRQDSRASSETGNLAPPFFQLDAFTKFYTQFKLTVEEGVALMGSHTTLRKQGCTQESNGKLVECNPDQSPCQNLRMYQFDNHYFTDGCLKKSTTTVDLKNVPFITGVDLSTANKKEKETLRREQMCRWTSASRRAAAVKELNDAIHKARSTGTTVPATLFVESQDFVNGTKLVPENKYAFGKRGGKPRPWPYTAHDARMASACQGNAGKPEIQAAMLKFAHSQDAFFEVYARAYVKMVDVGAKYQRKTFITGRECPRGWKSNSGSTKACQQSCPDPTKTCPADCFC